jgi:hypothetical protein
MRNSEATRTAETPILLWRGERKNDHTYKKQCVPFRLQQQLD